ncbi:MAG: nucleoside monophosphate kinase [Mycoplasmataceae bacterium]|jgi:adenylate kinase|nr:nucleoside monophosphate kinase [Mycoplasmataceae bacterium]
MIVLLLGAPGSGKGTVSSILINKYDFRQISTGDLLRAEVKSGSELGKQIDEIMKSGNFVSAELVNNLVKEYIGKYKEQGKNIVLDGYPRNIDQANFIATYANIDKVIELYVPEDILIKRLTGRLNCPVCGAGYNINTTSEYMPNVIDGKYICKKCGVELSQRKDDNLESVKHRLHVYEEQTLPLVNHYNTKGIVSKYNSDGSADEIASKIVRE